MPEIFKFHADTQKRDTDGSIMPWYTFAALDWIKENIPDGLSVLEFGGGNSTLWWRKRATVTTIENNARACIELGIDVSSPIGYFSVATEMFDIVILDASYPGVKRQDYILKAFSVCKKYFIVDNWQQPAVSMYSQDVVDHLYNNSIRQHVFSQPQHADGSWKTAIFEMK